MNLNKIGIGILIALSLGLFSCQTALADAPYSTFTQGPDGMMVFTQTAYEPDGLIRLDANMPEDLFYHDATGTMYIADSGNSRIVVIDRNGAVRTVGEDILFSPSGVYVTGDNTLYVADYGLEQVVVFDAEGNLVKQIGRPEEPIYGAKNDFAPKKVAVDKRGNIYVISEGSINGVVQLNHDGGFLGYVGANDTDISLKMLIQRFVFTEEQKSRLFRTTPPSPTSLVLDRQGLLYTVTNGISAEGIKKLNIVGDNILASEAWQSPNLIDIDVDDNGNIYTLDSEGWIDIYDSFGNLLFDFGGKDSKYERAGMLRNPSAIDVSSSGESIFIADRDRNVINRYRITPFAGKVFEGVAYYKQGLYVESEEIWKEILRMNSFFILSYEALAKSYFKQNLNEQALESFKRAEDKDGYSDAYWNIRNDWLQTHMVTLVYAALALILLYWIVRLTHVRFGILTPAVQLADTAAENKLIRELGFLFHFLRHPIDAVQELKENKRATIRSATILYVWLLLLQVLLVYATGYLFADGDPARMSLLPILLTTAVPLLFWVVMNYLVSTVGDGEGRFSEVYIGTIYALGPYLVFALPIALVTNVLTYNESFLYNYSMAFIEGWSVLLLCIMVKELHDFTFAQTVRNLLLTIFGMVLAALVIFILVFLFTQEIEFIRSIIQELRNRVS